VERVVPSLHLGRQGLVPRRLRSPAAAFLTPGLAGNGAASVPANTLLSRVLPGVHVRILLSEFHGSRNQPPLTEKVCP
jgi:hypothetical protein